MQTKRYLAALAIAIATPVTAQAATDWQLANEYPATSLPGEGDAHFAKLVAEKTKGKIAIVPVPDAKLGYKSREQLKAVAEGRLAMADTFGGAIGEDVPVLGFSSLPFLATDIAQARSLYKASRSAYETAFERNNQKLLYATPWPPSGIWAKEPVTSVEALSRLKIRTYDLTGSLLFIAMGAKASLVSFADLPAKIASGEIDAVLSSGDGGAGRKLWEHFPQFTAINYAIPLSFTTVNLDLWKGLDEGLRRALEDAAFETELRQWKALDGRLEQNYERMRANGMTIVTEVPLPLRTRLREAAKAAIDEWVTKAGPDGAALLATKDRAP
jgi:TRAP-type C4-dicarboxylate transport system substrate-binding protein